MNYRLTGGNDNTSFSAYIWWMRRSLLTVFLAFAIALVGYQPFKGMTASAQDLAMQMSSSSDADCPEMKAGDCCDKTKQDMRFCLWNDACAVRCHINIGLEAAFIVPAMRMTRMQSVAFAKPPPLHAERVSRLFRPPII